MKLDTDGPNLYWKPDEPGAHLFVTSLRTLVSKVVVPSPGEVFRMAVDTQNGIIFWASSTHIFQARIERPGRGYPLITEKLGVRNKEPIIDIAVDTRNQYVYWCVNQAEILRKPYSGGDVQKLVLKTHPYGGIQPNTMRHFENHLYFVRGNSKYGYLLSKLNWESQQEFNHRFGSDLNISEVVAMEIYETGPNGEQSQCQELKCSHLCLPLYPDGGDQCACPSYLTLNGSSCSLSPLAILAYRGENESSTNQAEKGALVLLHQKKDEIGLQQYQVTELPNMGHESFGLQAALDSQVCLHTADNATTKVKCLLGDSGPDDVKDENKGQSPEKLELLLDQFLSSQPNHSRILKAFTDGKQGFVFSFDPHQQCVYVLNAATLNSWKAFCATPKDIDPAYIDVDPVEMILFYRNVTSGKFQSTSLRTQETNKIDVYVGNTETSMDAATNLLCADSTNRRLMWAAGSKVKWSSYEGSRARVYSSSQVLIKRLRCTRGAPFWIQVEGRSHESLVTFVDELAVTEKVYRGVANETILDFLFESDFDPESVENIQCLKMNCSHGCMPQPGESTALCFCPPYMMLRDNHTCNKFTVLARFGDQQLHIVTFSGDSRDDHVNVFQPGPGTTALDKVTDLLQHLSIPPPARTPNKLASKSYGMPFDLAVKEDDIAVCSMDTLTLSCQSVSTGEKKFIGYLDRFLPVFALNTEGTHIIWAANHTEKTHTLRNFKITKIANQESLSFINFDMQAESTNLVTLDVSNGKVFWCDNKDESVQAKTLLEDDQRATILHRWDTRESPHANCTAIAHDPHGERVFVIYGNKVFLLPYNGGSALKIADLSFQEGQNLAYRNAALILVTPSGAIQVLDVSSDAENSSPDNVSLFKASSGNILAVKPMNPDNEHGSSTSCSPVSCFRSDSSSDELHRTSCKCPNSQYFGSKSEGLTKELSSFTIVTMTGIALSAVLLLISSMICYRRRTTRKLHENVLLFIEGSPNFPFGKDSPPYEKVPFSKEIDLRDLQIQENVVLGEGSFGVVYSGIYGRNQVAVKTLRQGSSKQMFMEFVRELKVMTYVGDHRNLVRFMGAVVSQANQGFLWMVFEKSHFGSLDNFLRKSSKGFSDSSSIASTISQGSAVPKLIGSEYQNISIGPRLSFPLFMYWSRQIADGMAYLESKEIVHGDLCANNVLVFGQNVVKVSDYGSCRNLNLYQSSSYLKKAEVQLPWRWAAVETLERSEFSPKSDVWAYGVTIWELFSMGKVPFLGFAWNDGFESRLKMGFRLKKPEAMPDDMYYVIVAPCWDLKSENRPQFSQLIDMIDEMYGSVLAKWAGLYPQGVNKHGLEDAVFVDECHS